MSIKPGDFIIYECPTTFDEKGMMIVEIKIVKINSLAWVHDHQQFIDEEGNFYDEYRIRKIIRDEKHIYNDAYDYGKIIKDSNDILEKKKNDDQSSSL